MKTNFVFLKENKVFDSFSEQAIEAEKSLIVSFATTAILSRRALELAVRWVFINDNDLQLPYRDNISALIHEDSFLRIIEPRLFPMLKYVIKLGNSAVHTNKKVQKDEAILSLRNLYEFCKWIQYCYAEEYEDTAFDEGLLEYGSDQKKKQEELKVLYDDLTSKDRKLEEIRKENKELREQMTILRKSNVGQRIFKVNEETEAETRKKYIDVDLADAGWTLNADCIVEVPVEGMPNPSGIGFVDYVLYGKNKLPLAVVEAKKTSVDPLVGSQQAKLYADCLEKQYKQRPFIFTTNGFETYFTDDYNDFPRRRVSGFFSQDELQLKVDRRKTQKVLEHIEIKDSITNRPYQKEAITAVCDAIKNKHRKMLIVQATGSGKTRVSISIVDVLRRHNYVKNVLFLADRTALVKQAKSNFSDHLQDLSLCNLLDSKDDPEQSRMIFSTYPTMLNAIDETKTKDGKKLFTPGHFDLIIVDESHRSIYKKYQDIFNYFDAMLLGMTATPKDDIDKNTYGVFELERGVPTYAYELEQAVEEGYLVDYSTLEYKTKIMENGIHYDELTEDEKEEFDEKFEADEYVDKEISSSAVNKWLFNADTIDMVLKNLMEKGLTVEGGDKLGKTIIFAVNSKHAAAIVDRFNVLFPECGQSFIKQIDYSIKYVDTLIDDFSTKNKMPQIAVSVDMLDTGIDIPEILNLVFFKKVRSYSKFWQMIGRGTRLCQNLLGQGLDKEKFLIFDYCSNFDFFRVKPNGSEGRIGESLSEKLFNCKTNIVRELQGKEYQDEDHSKYRMDLIVNLHGIVMKLEQSSFRVKQHMRYVQTYRELSAWKHLETVAISEIKEHIAPIVIPEKGDELSKRFDYVMYSLELAMLQSRNAANMVNIVLYTAEQLSRMYSVHRKIEQQKSIIERVLTNEFWDNASILDMEVVRDALRELVQYIEKLKQPIYYTHFTDKVISEETGEAFYGSTNLKNYRKKVEFYLKKHQDNLVVYKLRHNKKLTASDMKELERVLWEELGTREDYQKEYGDTPIGNLVRKIVGVDREAVNEAFSEFLSEERLNINQLRFVRLMVDYIVANGNIENNAVLMEEPFRSAGSITVLFKNDMVVARKILSIAGEIKRNSEEIA